MTTHLLIPDAQVGPGTPTEHLAACGNFIMEHRPDVIVNIGDHADMPSLCSYDQGKKSFEGRRYALDIVASKEGMETLLEPMARYNRGKRRTKAKQYRPRMVLTLGNHEHRITRAVESDARLDGTIGIADLEYDKFGWDVYDYLQPVEIDGITYVHFAQQALSPTAIQRAHLIAARRHCSYSVGHTQILDYHVSSNLVNGRRVQCLIAGAFYAHDEEYKGPQGNQHWRGIILKRNVNEGQYDPQFISIDTLIKDYL